MNIRWRSTPADISRGNSIERRRRTMKRFWILSLIGLVLSVSVVGSQSAKTSETEQAVAALEQQWLQAQKTNNPDLIVPLLADNFVDTSRDRKSTRLNSSHVEI